MTHPNDPSSAPQPPDSRGEGHQEAKAAPVAAPPGMPPDGPRGRDLDAATGTLVGAGLGGLIWGVLILLYIWWR